MFLVESSMSDQSTCKHIISLAIEEATEYEEISNTAITPIVYMEHIIKSQGQFCESMKIH